jgi:TetR/AcrR family transcriptional regulator, regulator of biofilm formation and stress response
MGRRHDPERRQRIIDAAIRVIAGEGVRGFSHRAVAAEADVPLGSTTYHFASLDDLLIAAMRQCNDTFAQQLRDFALPPTPEGVADALAGLVEEWVMGDRARTEVEYELYLAAVRRPAVRPTAAEWVDLLTHALTARTDETTARALAALADGLALQTLLTGRLFDRARAKDLFARLISAA